MAKQALKGSRLNTFAMDPEDLVIIGIDTDDGSEHPLYDDRIKLPLDEALVLNIMAHGVLETVSVRKNGDAPEVVYGRQRVRAAREANKRLKKQGSKPIKIPVSVRRGKDTQMFGVMVSENEHRRDDGPLEKAEKLRRYLDMGGTEEEAAIDFGVTPTSIRNWLKLLDLEASVRKAVEKGIISASAAGKLAPLSREEQKAALAEVIEKSGGKATTKAAGGAVKKAKGEEAHTAPGKRLIRKVVAIHGELVADGEEGLPEDFIRGVRWAIGELSESSIKGLTAIVAEAQGGPKVK